MNMKNVSLIQLALAFLTTARASAQQPVVPAIPTPGCTSTPAQLEATKKVAMRHGIRVRLRSPWSTRATFSTTPAQQKRAEEDKVSDFEEFRKIFVAPGDGGGAGGGRGPATGPQTCKEIRWRWWWPSAT